MVRKKPVDDQRLGNDRVGLIVTRGQVKHLGHATLEAQMLVDNGTSIVAYGSSQVSGVYNNPLTPEQKRKAQVGLWGDAFKMVFLQDIGATDRSTDWCDYVIDRLESNQLPRPTDLYAGSKHEARWYEKHFASLQGEHSYMRGMFKVWENPETGHRIHILDRNIHVPISSSEVRSMIERRDPQWRNFVPQRLWDFYEQEYPPELRAAIHGDFLAEDGSGTAEYDYPVGTKALRPGDDETIWVLRDDGKWRPRTQAELDAKSLGD